MFQKKISNSKITSITIANRTKDLNIDLIDVKDNNENLKNATINSSIEGNGAKYRETWTDFAQQIDKYHPNLKRERTIEIEEGITKIHAYAFDKVTKLTMISLPTTLTTFPAYAINNCDTITTVYYLPIK